MLKRKNSWALQIGMGIAGCFAVFSAGCGAAPNGGSYAPLTGNAVPTVNCGAGQARFGTTCAATFEQACAMSYGYMMDANTCRATSLPRTYPVGAYRLTATDGGAALSTVTVFAGDKITISASGGWGSPNASSTLWGLVKWYSFSSNTCSKVSVSGRGTDGNIVLFGNAPAGLMGTDGAQTFEIGSGMTRTAASSGILRLGMNVPAASDYCYTASATVQVTHCENRNGQTISCP